MGGDKSGVYLVHNVNAQATTGLGNLHLGSSNTSTSSLNVQDQSLIVHCVWYLTCHREARFRHQSILQEATDGSHRISSSIVIKRSQI